MDNRTFLFHTSWAEVFDDLTDAQTGALIKALCRHVATGGAEATDLSGDCLVRVAFKFISKNIDMPASAASPTIPANDKKSDATAERARLLEILFFDKRIKNAATELERFLNHYEARGWRDNSGAPIRNRAALLRAWTVKDARMLTDRFLRGYRTVYEKAKEITGDAAPLMITGFRGYEDTGGDFVMCVSKPLHDFMENNITALQNSIKTITGKSKLTYKIIRE